MEATYETLLVDISIGLQLYVLQNARGKTEMTAKENKIIRLLRWLGILKPVPISKGEMCEQAKSVCNKECANCAWNGGRYDR